MEITYGINVVSNEDRFLTASAEAIGIARRATIPGTFLVNTIPIRVSHDVPKYRIVQLMTETSEVRSRVVPRSGVQNLREGNSCEIQSGCGWTARVREGVNEGQPTEWPFAILTLTTVIILISLAGPVTRRLLGHVLIANLQSRDLKKVQFERQLRVCISVSNSAALVKCRD